MKETISYSNPDSAYWRIRAEPSDVLINVNHRTVVRGGQMFIVPGERPVHFRATRWRVCRIDAAFDSRGPPNGPVFSNHPTRFTAPVYVSGDLT